MASVSKFPIPEEFKDKLDYTEPADKRSDEEIISSLEQYAPVTSEKVSLRHKPMSL